MFFFSKYFDFWYMFLFFLEHIKNELKKNRVNDCLNMVEIKFRDHYIKLKIPGWYYSPNYSSKYVSKIEHFKYTYNGSYFFLNLLTFGICFFFSQSIENIKKKKKSCQRLSELSILTKF